MRILVTGASGFIGQHLVRRLAKSASVDEIVALDRVAYPSTRVAGVPVRAEVGDIRDYSVVERATKGADSVVHLAAIASVPLSVEHPVETHEVNATGTLNVLEAARRLGAGGVVVASSSAVYGEHPAAEKDENLPLSFLSPYAASKGATESYALAYQAAYGMNVVAFRFFNVFGPGQMADHPYAAVIPRFLHSIATRIPLEVFGDGEQTRDFVSVHTVVDALVKSAMRQLRSTTPVNVASGHSISLRELVHELEVIHGQTLDVTYRPERPGDIRHSGAKVEALAKLVPDLDVQRFSTALNEVYNWYITTSADDSH